MSFKDVIEAISKFAFVASPYPVVISLETRCCSEQQVVMARIFREVLGDSMVIAPVSESETKLPSPTALMHKIIVKVRMNVNIY